MGRLEVRIKRALPALVTASAAVLIVAPGASADDTECGGPLTGVHDNVVVPPGANCELTNAFVRGNVTVLETGNLTARQNVVGGNVQATRSGRFLLDGGTVEGDVEVKEANTDLISICGVRVTGGNVVNEMNRTTIANQMGGLSQGTRLVGAAGASFCNPEGGLQLDEGNVILRQNSANAFGATIVRAVAPNGNVIAEQNDVMTAAVPPSEVVLGPNLAVTGNQLERGNVFVQENILGQPAVGSGFLPGLNVRTNDVDAGNVQVLKNRGVAAKNVVLNTVAQNLQCFENDPAFAGQPNTARQAEGQCGTASVSTASRRQCPSTSSSDPRNRSPRQATWPPSIDHRWSVRAPVESIEYATLAIDCTAVAGTARETADRLRANQFKFTSERPGAATGVRIEVSLARGGPEAAVAAITMKLARGTGFDTSVPEGCGASDEELVAQGAAACPSSSRVGSGLVELAELGTGDLILFNSNRETIFLIEFRDAGIRTVSRGSATGRTQRIEIAEGGTLERVQLAIDRIRAGGETYIETPDRCPPVERWINSGIFLYRDGVGQREQKPTPCKRRSG